VVGVDMGFQYPFHAGAQFGHARDQLVGAAVLVRPDLGS
jgi:hypothetical protein